MRDLEVGTLREKITRTDRRMKEKRRAIKQSPMNMQWIFKRRATSNIPNHPYSSLENHL